METMERVNLPARSLYSPGGCSLSNFVAKQPAAGRASWNVIKTEKITEPIKALKIRFQYRFFCISPILLLAQFSTSLVFWSVHVCSFFPFILVNVCPFPLFICAFCVEFLLHLSLLKKNQDFRCLFRTIERDCMQLAATLNHSY